jgi:mono/diheme cytochrome c family protein
MHQANAVRQIQGVLVAILIVALSVVLYGQQAKPVIEKVAPSPTSAASGPEMYRAYCAVCHGANGKGNGPAAPALKVAPGDLTKLTAKNKGKFPELRVFSVITGDVEMVAHGSRDMPVWGSLFRDMHHGDDAQVKLRLRNLTKYIESIQAK